jgi:hypothetical protein
VLSAPSIQRFARQLLLPEIGMSGQELLATAQVAVGGDSLAAITARDYLARAGVGAAAPEVQDEESQADVRFALSEVGFAWSAREGLCEDCLRAFVDGLPKPPPSERAAVAMAAGALAASQLMLAPLGRLSGASSGAGGVGVGFRFWPALFRAELKPRVGCDCGAPPGG